MKYGKRVSFFRGKGVNYSTEVTATKGETVLIWVLTFIVFASIFASFIFTDSFIIPFITIFVGIFILMGTMILIIFSKSHEEERIQNSNKIKYSTKDGIEEE